MLALTPLTGGCSHRPIAATPAATVPTRSPARLGFHQPATIPGVDNFAEVAPGLYRGAQPTAEGFAELKRRGVRTVINLRQFHDDTPLLGDTGLTCIAFPSAPWSVDDALLKRFLAVVNDPANQPVFVHCQHGADRTGFVVGGYRILVQGWDGDAAIAELRAFGFHSLWLNIPRRLQSMAQAQAACVAATSPAGKLSILHSP